MISMDLPVELRCSNRRIFQPSGTQMEETISLNLTLGSFRFGKLPSIRSCGPARTNVQKVWAQHSPGECWHQDLIHALNWPGRSRLRSGEGTPTLPILVSPCHSSYALF